MKASDLNKKFVETKRDEVQDVCRDVYWLVSKITSQSPKADAKKAAINDCQDSMKICGKLLQSLNALENTLAEIDDAIAEAAAKATNTTKQKAKINQLSVDDVISGKYAAAFLEFSKKEHTEVNIEFLVHCTKRDPDERTWDLFIPNGSTDLNIDSKCLQRLNAAYANKSGNWEKEAEAAWDDAIKTTRNLIERDTMLRFRAWMIDNLSK